MRLALALLASWPATVLALPQFSVRSARMCSNCHIAPTGWDNPSLAERKCSLSCGTCHLNPTGGGMRNVAGRYYGREILPLFGERPSRGFDVLKKGPPARPASRPDDAIEYEIPEPGTDARYGGLEALPWWQLGGDLRAMAWAPTDGRALAVFPMQAELYLAASPYNPPRLNEGRLSLYANLGLRGRAAEPLDGLADRLQVKEWWALLHDLPYQLYAKLGRFQPVFGWRLDDHSALIREGQGFDHQRQVTGVELGLNPNYLYAHASAFLSGPAWDDPFATSEGAGAAISAGYRELLWQAGASFMFEEKVEGPRLWAGASWSLNLHDATDAHRDKGLDWFPLIYLGELDYSRRDPDAGRAVSSLATFHELDVLAVEGVNLKARYDWQDPDLEVRENHRHRYTVGVEVHPYTFVELIAQYRFNVLATGPDFHEVLVQVHGWY